MLMAGRANIKVHIIANLLLATTYSMRTSSREAAEFVDWQLFTTKYLNC